VTSHGKVGEPSQVSKGGGCLGGWGGGTVWGGVWAIRRWGGMKGPLREGCKHKRTV